VFDNTNKHGAAVPECWAFIGAEHLILTTLSLVPTTFFLALACPPSPKHRVALLRFFGYLGVQNSSMLGPQKRV